MHRNRAYYGIQLAQLQLALGDTTSAKATAATVMLLGLPLAP
ncbi:hypothetical protein ACIQWZ_39950 [Streptomyces sp. NPDC098077]